MIGAMKRPKVGPFGIPTKRREPHLLANFRQVHEAAKTAAARLERKGGLK